MTNRKHVFGLLTAIGVGLCAPASFAEAHFFNGVTCMPVNFLSSNDMLNQWGIGNNDPNNTRPVACPLIVDHAVGGVINSVTANLYDRHSTLDVSCRLTVTDIGGNTIFTSVQNTTGSSLSLKQMAWNVGMGNFGILECTLPPRTATGTSHVTGYIVQ